MTHLIGEDRHCGRYTDPELWCLREPYEMFYCPCFTVSNLSIRALLIQAQLAWARAYNSEFQPVYFYNAATCEAVSCGVHLHTLDIVFNRS